VAFTESEVVIKEPRWLHDYIELSASTATECRAALVVEFEPVYDIYVWHASL